MNAGDFADLPPPPSSAQVRVEGQVVEIRLPWARDLDLVQRVLPLVLIVVVGAAPTGPLLLRLGAALGIALLYLGYHTVSTRFLISRNGLVIVRTPMVLGSPVTVAAEQVRGLTMGHRSFLSKSRVREVTHHHLALRDGRELTSRWHDADALAYVKQVVDQVVPA